MKRSEEKRTEENPREEQPSSETAGSDPGSSDPAEDLRMAKQDKARKDATRMREQTEKLDLTLSALSAPDRALLDRMLAGQQLDPKRAGKPLTLLQQANQAEIFAKELLEHGPDCWRACCEIACGREVYTAEFARGCTKNWKPTSQDPFGGGGYGKQQRLMGPMPASAFGEIAPRPTE